jgi:hypothetical protein
MQIGFQSTTAQRAVWGFRAVSGPFNRWTYACRPQKKGRNDIYLFRTAGAAGSVEGGVQGKGNIYLPIGIKMRDSLGAIA